MCARCSLLSPNIRKPILLSQAHPLCKTGIYAGDAHPCPRFRLARTKKQSRRDGGGATGKQLNRYRYTTFNLRIRASTSRVASWDHGRDHRAQRFQLVLMMHQLSYCKWYTRYQVYNSHNERVNRQKKVRVSVPDWYYVTYHEVVRVHLTTTHRIYFLGVDYNFPGFLLSRLVSGRKSVRSS